MNNKKNESEVEILVGDNGYVDLAYPIDMTLEQLNKFLTLLKKIYDPRAVISKNVSEFKRDWRIGEKVLYPRPWAEEDYLILFECDSIEKASELLGRSPYAAGLKDADWRYRIFAFCDKHGYDLNKDGTLKIIQKFMAVQEEFNKSRKELRKERTKLKNELDSLNSPEKKEHLDFLKKMKKIDAKYLINEEKKKKIIKKRLEEIEKLLSKKIDEF